MANKSFKKIRSIGLIIALLLILLEFSLRIFLGLGNPPLFEVDKDIGYYYKANQNLRRFGNRIYYNQYHQRSDELMEKPAYRILIIGNSVTDGGAIIDQKDTISEILERKLNQYLGRKGEVLNASAKAWSIENKYEYIKKFGIFDSDIVIVQLSNRDIAQAKTPSAVVGSLDFPSHRSLLAISELYRRYLIPRLLKTESENIYFKSSNKDKFSENLQILEKMIEYIKISDKKILILLMPQRKELDKEILLKERKILAGSLDKKNIKYINFMDKKYGLQKKYFRDDSHLNIKGDSTVANILFEYIIKNNFLRNIKTVEK